MDCWVDSAEHTLRTLLELDYELRVMCVYVLITADKRVGDLKNKIWNIDRTFTDLEICTSQGNYLYLALQS